MRFNSAEGVTEKGILIGMEVYFAPRTKHTAYVFLDSLFQQRGSDASWENDQEPPEHCLDYSDDEQERKAKAALRNKKRTRPESNFEQTNDNGRKFQPRSQQNTHGRGRQRGGHNSQRRQPQNPFYMSLSNNYGEAEQNVLSTATALSNAESSQVTIDTASSILSDNSLPEPVKCDEAIKSHQPDQPIISTPQLDSNDLKISNTEI